MLNRLGWYFAAQELELANTKPKVVQNMVDNVVAKKEDEKPEARDNAVAKKDEKPEARGTAEAPVAQAEAAQAEAARGEVARAAKGTKAPKVAWQTVWDTTANTNSTKVDAGDLKFMPFKEELEASSKYLRKLRELIGPPPADGHWTDEWFDLSVEYYKIAGFEDDYAQVKEMGVEEYCRQNNNLQAAYDCYDPSARYLEGRGWPFEHGRIVMMAGEVRACIAKAIREESPKYARMTYALCDAIYLNKGATDTDVPLPMYIHRYGRGGLNDDEPAWEDIEKPADDGAKRLW